MEPRACRGVLCANLARYSLVLGLEKFQLKDAGDSIEAKS